MTRSQRRARSRAARSKQSLGRYMSAPSYLTENPNRAKHGAARIDCTDERTARGIAEARRDYRPLTVTTPLPDKLGRRSRSRSSYTI